ncbi:undecaprenyldiphospho-muramoylpentapeptide beta-N-acetylglucosaminyltransferase [Candidatus Enterovibrio escicola]|nr:undecaprenyldiphospho-muramoylpentapeptide beta-N-acetylglucosaminyltransferase [Candidatus Enterovibrio escacola]
MTKHNEQQGKRLLVMAGGTGGHVFSGLSVAKMLQQEGWDIRWLGTTGRMEADIVPKHGIEIDFIEVKGLRNTNFTRKLSAPWMVVNAVLQARKHIHRWQPDVVLGMGGYVSGPGGLAAWLSGIPVVIHEQNAVAGLTNKCLSRIALRVLQAFPSAFPKGEVVGNPIRAGFCVLPAPSERLSEVDHPLKVFVMGGSQGAHILNYIVPLVMSSLQRNILICHQAGKGNQADTMQRYQKLNVANVEVTEFIDDVVATYQWANLLICRSGALTVSEVAAAGVAAIFIPFQHKDNQQVLNARYLVNKGAAIMIEQPELIAEKLTEMLGTLDSNTLRTMAEAARNAAVIDASSRVANIIKGIVD